MGQCEGGSDKKRQEDKLSKSLIDGWMDVWMELMSYGPMDH